MGLIYWLMVSIDRLLRAFVCWCIVDLFRFAVFGRSFRRQNICRRLRCAVRYSLSVAVSPASAVGDNRRELSWLQLCCLSPTSSYISQWCRLALGKLFKVARLQKTRRKTTSLAAVVAGRTATTRTFGDQSSLCLRNKGKQKPGVGPFRCGVNAVLMAF